MPGVAAAQNCRGVSERELSDIGVPRERCNQNTTWFSLS
jgi:hypothetical protein